MLNFSSCCLVHRPVFCTLTACAECIVVGRCACKSLLGPVAELSAVTFKVPVQWYVSAMSDVSQSVARPFRSSTLATKMHMQLQLEPAEAVMIMCLLWL